MKDVHTSSQSRFKTELIEWIKILAAAVVLAFFLNSCVIANSVVPSNSMENTIMTGDRIIASRLSYRLSQEPKRGDIVIFDHKAEPGKDKTRLVKRIIGLPGEMIEIKNNHIYINQSEVPLEEPYLAEAMETSDKSFHIPEGCYLMLGDNRNYSSDARAWPDPYVPKDEIIAKVIFRYYPNFKVIQ